MNESSKSSSQESMSCGFVPSAGPEFVATEYVKSIAERALAYLGLGYALHLSGPAGTGKTTLALHIASLIGQPCIMLHGDDEFSSADLVGREAGFKRTSIRDNYISSIVKSEESVSLNWKGNRLTRACQLGHTLIYDEFTRSPATANNPFLSVLEEGILSLPAASGEGDYLRVHPTFRAIFTSNPEEYVGVHKTQDALLDRMITLELGHPDEATEVAILQAKANCTVDAAKKIIGIVRCIRERCGTTHGPTVRSAIAIARVVQLRGCQIRFDDPVFATTCLDVLRFPASRQAAGKISEAELLDIVRRQAPAATPKVETQSNSSTPSIKVPEEPVLMAIQAELDELATDTSVQLQHHAGSRLPKPPANVPSLQRELETADFAADVN